MDKSKSEAADGAALASPAEDAELVHLPVPRQPEPIDQTLQRTRSEMIELGRVDLVDEFNASLVAARPKPRGLLPVPPAVEAAMAEDDSLLWTEHGLIPTSEDQKRQLNSLTLQYYYGGHDVAYRVTPEGIELLADGLIEIRELTQGMSQDQLLTIKIGRP